MVIPILYGYTAQFRRPRVRRATGAQTRARARAWRMNQRRIVLRRARRYRAPRARVLQPRRLTLHEFDDVVNEYADTNAMEQDIRPVFFQEAFDYYGQNPVRTVPQAQTIVRQIYRDLLVRRVAMLERAQAARMELRGDLFGF
jgi:hypothetical protein